MDFALEHIKEDGVAVKSNIRVLPTKNDGSIDDKALLGANEAARILFGTTKDKDDSKANASLYPEHILPTKSIIKEGALIVIFQSFDNLSFAYVKSGSYFQNRNGIFPHASFIGRSFGSIVRSSDREGYGFVHLLKPTPELWTRTLPHRTQIIHELDASMMCHYLELRPNMNVCESGTGSGSMSHAILRSIAPYGKLYTHEFNEVRAQKAKEEFEKNGVAHMVEVIHRDVCGKVSEGGFYTKNNQKVHAVLLDLPEPWLAVPYAAKVLRRGSGRIASYSPCVEQVQRCTKALRAHGFHSIRTLEFRLREYYVDRVQLERPPQEKRPRLEQDELHHLAYVKQPKLAKDDDDGAGKDSNSEAEKNTTTTDDDNDSEKKVDVVMDDTTTTKNGENKETKTSTKQIICTRPFNNIKGHSAFITFATVGLRVLNPNNNSNNTPSNNSSNSNQNNKKNNGAKG
mmetsp:Transcript_43164/g.48996  ORF Transcript_43164/g.48996 Transcript_43164/m.48996 type:complete len:457 (+) Transcript_43164:289-1659(+)|eukprot:CAMPEP_0194140322 /NCGR_PEP_ID=MMETSP0152-20130528/9874_1 /TAXON_ID=1049557 /ORGANISM="Thalassiothrix antarctica, Strain L6-D1" /LENGTH=456 /DNA_ID=CAMNT_0038838519 /DNA_START=61 /DNA_END=1431 /DNA_ORIENTATION=-